MATPCEMENVVKCDMCDFKINLQSDYHFYEHMKGYHGLSSNFSSDCKIYPCVNEYFTKFASFQRHFYRKHDIRKKWNIPKSSNSSSVSLSSELQTSTMGNFEDGVINQNTLQYESLNDLASIDSNTRTQDECSIHSVEAQHQPHPQKEIVSMQAESNNDGADFLMETSITDGNADRPLPRRSITSIELLSGSLLSLRLKHFLTFDALTDVKSLLDEYCSKKISELQTSLQEILPCSVSSSEAFQQIFFAHMDSAVNGELSTRSKMEDSWKKRFPPVMPVAIPVNCDEIPPRLQWVKNDQGKTVLEGVPDTGYIVNFKESLTQLLNIKDVHEAVLQSFFKNSASSTLAAAAPKTYSDFWDGDFIRKNSVFIQQNGKLLAVQVYFDEVETANPLGSNKGVHKMAMFYWTLLNLPLSMRSNLRSIQLLGCIPADLLKTHGPSKFLQPFLTDLLQFQRGIELNIRGQTTIWHVVFGNFSGDMPASNFIGGFKESGSAIRPCRVCFIHRSELDSVHHEVDCVLRDKQTHTQHVDELSRKSSYPLLRTQLSKDYGINGPCVFSALPYFDPTKCFPHDLMHVGAEGVANLELKFLLQKLIASEEVEIDKLNFFVSQSKSHREFTLPPPIRYDEVMLPGKKLSFSASEMSSLINLVPLYLGQTINPLQNPFYSNFLLLLKILSSLQCYSFTESDLLTIEFEIFQHNKAFCSLYPKGTESGSAITPKLHSLIHFPTMIRLFGPPRTVWCFRYESKNAQFKKYMRRQCNFLNVPFTLSANHQKKVGLDCVIDGESKYFGTDPLELDIVSVERSNPVLLKNSCWARLIFDSKFSDFVTENSLVKTVLSFSLSGRLCKKGTVFVREISKDDNDEDSHFHPNEFWRVSDVVTVQNKTLMILQQLENCGFNLDQFSFVVKPLPQFEVIQPSELKFPVPLQSFKLICSNNDGNINVIPNYYNLL